MNQPTSNPKDPKTGREAPPGPAPQQNGNAPSELDAMPARREDDEPHPNESVEG